MVITDVNQVVYQGNGSNTAFPFTFRIIDATDIKLLLIDVDGTETDITSDYFVDTVNSTVHYPGYAPGAEPSEADQPAPVQTGQRLVVYRELPVTQEKDLGERWPFYVIELALDKLTMLIQQVKDVLSLCMKIPLTDKINGFDTKVPVKPNTVIVVNQNGNGFECLEDPYTAAKEAEAAARSAEESADRAYRVTPEALRWMENFLVKDGKFYQVMKE